ncbi:MAG: GvpL/GvpF family gas vesicle protein [bacterium]
MTDVLAILGICRDAPPSTPEVRVVSGEGLHALLWRVPLEHIQKPSRELLIRYEKMVRDLFEAIDILPFRFGTVAHAEESVTALLTARKPWFDAQLERLSGHVEMGIRVPVADTVKATQPAANDPPATTGRDFLKQRLRHYQAELDRDQRARSIQTSLQDALGDVISEVHVETSTRAMFAAPTVSLSYLVRRENVDRFLAVIAQAAPPDATVSGPWPPYSFVQSEDP